MSLKGQPCWVVNIRMDDAEKLSLEAIGRFVVVSENFRFEAAAAGPTGFSAPGYGASGRLAG